MKQRFKVVRIDKTGSSAIMTNEARELAKVNAELVGVDCVTEDEIIEAAKDADAILTLTGQITRRVMEASPKCKVIGTKWCRRPSTSLTASWISTRLGS